MRIMKFEGATMRDAIAKVKAELGDQAVIISSRQVRKGLLGSAVEISAAIDDDNDEQATPARLDESPAFTRKGFAGAYGSNATNREPATTPHNDGPDVEKLIAPLRNELRSLRAMVRSSTPAAEPKTTKLEGEIAALRALVEQFVATAATPAPAPPRQVSASAESISQAVQAAAAKRAHRADQEDDAPIIAPSTARIVMLVGPTGAGKTTTIAKLAAHAALVEGRRVRLITLDTYRVGGVDQIRTFADLIGVQLTVLDRPSELANAIDDDDDLTLIDTAGRSPRDVTSVVELAQATAKIRELETHLVIPASLTASQIDALVTRYTALAPARLLFTKVDEHEAIPQLLEAPRRTRLPITWVATGQQVPEDLEQPTAKRLGMLAANGLSQPVHRSHRAA